MTKLIVNDIEIALGSDFSFQVVDENPVITSVGEFTLDITVSLKMGMNARAFGMIGRVNKRNIPAHWPASLIVNNKASYGKAIYLSNTDETVTIQYVSGNSELRYYTGQNEKIWQFDWGQTDPITYEWAYWSILQNGYIPGMFPYVCAPVKLGGEIVNNFKLKDETGTLPFNPFQIESIEGPIVMMPYLLYYVEKLPELFGFTLKSNVLRDNLKAKRMYVINHVNSVYFADALPDITLGEFIEIIENTFNVIFLVDKVKLTLDIKYRNEYIDECPVVKVENVLDAYTRNSSENSDDMLKRFKADYFMYDLPDAPYYKYHRISNDVLGKTVVFHRGTYQDMKDYLVANPSAGWNSNVIEVTTNYDGSDRRYYIYSDPPPLDLFSREIVSGKNVYQVHKFENKGFSTWRNVMSLKLIPAVFEKEKKEAVLWLGTSNAKVYDVYYQLPVSNYELISTGSALAFGVPVTELIDNGVQDVDRGITLETAIFMSDIKAFVVKESENITFDVYYPFSCNDNFPDFGLEPGNPNSSRFDTWATGYFNSINYGTYRLEEYVEMYRNNNVFDSDKEYVFQFSEHPFLLSSNLFEINHAIYIPIRFERSVSEKNDLVTGYFYRMK